MSKFYEGESLDAATFDPVAACIESGADSLLLDQSALSPAFFDLSTGVAGELLHRLSTYRIRMAAVISDPSVYSEPFQDFIREANRGNQFCFVRHREEAIRWLESMIP